MSSFQDIPQVVPEGVQTVASLCAAISCIVDDEHAQKARDAANYIRLLRHVQVTTYSYIYIFNGSHHMLL